MITQIISVIIIILISYWLGRIDGTNSAEKKNKIRLENYWRSK